MSDYWVYDLKSCRSYMIRLYNLLTPVTIVYWKSSAKLAPFKRLIDLFLGAESRFFSQTNQFSIIDHVLYSVLIGIFNQ